jgi:rubrerythrin
MRATQGEMTVEEKVCVVCENCGFIQDGYADWNDSGCPLCTSQEWWVEFS